jgi:hypothetical protein
VKSRFQAFAFKCNAYRYNKEMGFAAHSLPEGANAAGIRPGVCTTLFAQMPDHMAISMTGHDMTGFTKLYEWGLLNPVVTQSLKPPGFNP